MTVVAADEDTVECIWLGEGGESFREPIPTLALERADGSDEDYEADPARAAADGDDEDDEDDDEEEEDEDEDEEARGEDQGDEDEEESDQSGTAGLTGPALLLSDGAENEQRPAGHNDCVENGDVSAQRQLVDKMLGKERTRKCR